MTHNDTSVVVTDGQAEPSGSAAARRYLRMLTWALYPVLAAVYYLVLASSLPSAIKLVPLELIYCTPIVVTVWFSYVAAHRCDEAERDFWASLGSANLLLFACEVLLVIWVYTIDPAGPPRVSWPFHIMHAAAAACFIFLLLVMSRFSQSSVPTKIRWSLDSVAVLVVVAVALTEFYTMPIMQPAGATTAEVLLGTGYPLFAVIMLVGTLGNLVGFKIDRWRTWDRLVVISLAIYAVAIALWPIWYPTALDTSRNYERGVLDLVQFGGHWLLMAAAVYRLTESSGWEVRPLPPIAVTRRWVSLALPAASIIAIPAILWLGVISHHGDSWFGVYTGAATLLTILVLARSVALSLEHGVLFHQSITDPLTGVYNHRFLHDHLVEQLDVAHRYGERLALLVFDIDDFAGYNRRHGHQAGDRLLSQAAGIMRSACAANCTVSRLGGDQFAVLAPQTDRVEAVLLGARLLDMVSIEAGSAPGSVSVSAGIAVYPDHAQDADGLLRLADGALFHSKETGKARATLFDQDRVPDLSAHERMERLQHQSRLASVRALAAAADARDASAHDHTRRVAQLSGQIARLLDLDERVVHRIEMGGLLHEIGRIALLDPSIDAGRVQLAEDERRHTIVGQQILSSSGLSDLAPMARSHHENWDGSGYPDGLAESEIPIEARILAVANRYDMLISGRTGGTARSPEQAVAEVESASAVEFDPTVVRALARSVLGQVATSCA